jgi:hypothetical protein
VRLRCLLLQGWGETLTGLALNEKQAVTRRLAIEYLRAMQKNKGRILAR